MKNLDLAAIENLAKKMRRSIIETGWQVNMPRTLADLFRL